MSGSHHPGTTLKATVVSVDGDQIVLQAEDSDDAGYFVVGAKYVLHVRLVGNDDPSGGDLSTAAG